MTVLRKWNLVERFILYSVVGFAAEFCVIATWNALYNGNRKLIGVTSVYVFFVYGIAVTVLEFMYKIMRNRVPLLIRAIIYTIFCYSWESLFGRLKEWDACPSDYASYFQNHFKGFLRSEYIPVWYIGTIFCEKLLIKPSVQAMWQLGGHGRGQAHLKHS